MSKIGVALLTLVCVVATSVGMSLVFNSGMVNAVSASEFLPGRIIDDDIFYDKNGMSSVAEIQNFLNAHTPSCDTWGTRSSGWQLDNAQYAQQIMGWHGLRMCA